MILQNSVHILWPIFTVKKNFTMRLVKYLNNESNLGFQDLVVIVGFCVEILKKGKLFVVFVILIVLFLCAGAP